MIVFNQYARALKIERVLLDVKLQGLIDPVQQPILTMRSHGYHIHDKIVQAVRQQVNE